MLWVATALAYASDTATQSSLLISRSWDVKLSGKLEKPVQIGKQIRLFLGDLEQDDARRSLSGT
jgi:hypothetical protein